MQRTAGFDTGSVEFWQFVCAILAYRLSCLYTLAGESPDVQLPLELFKGSVEVTAELTPTHLKLTGARHTPASLGCGALIDCPVSGRPL
jgi:hypothetical protein